MNGKLRIVLCALAGTGLAGALFGGLASGHSAKFKSMTTAVYVNVEAPDPRGTDPIDYFSGQVTQRYLKPNCTGLRTIRITGPVGDPKFADLGKVRTDFEGDWSLSAEDVPPGTYHVHLLRRKLRGLLAPHKGSHLCVGRPKIRVVQVGP